MELSRVRPGRRPGPRGPWRRPARAATRPKDAAVRDHDEWHRPHDRPRPDPRRNAPESDSACVQWMDRKGPLYDEAYDAY